MGLSTTKKIQAKAMVTLKVANEEVRRLDTLVIEAC